MRRRLGVVTLLVAGLALGAGAMPALTADNGSIVGTISVDAVAPCIALSTTALDYGTRPFAATGQSSFRYESFTVTNCSTAESVFNVSGTNAAAGGGASWALTDDWTACDGTLNKYGLLLAELPESFSNNSITTTPQTLWHYRAPANTVANTFLAGEAETFANGLYMPCVGSDGAGQTLSFGIALTATVA